MLNHIIINPKLLKLARLSVLSSFAIMSLSAHSVSAENIAAKNTSFWQASQGYWLAQNTYLDSHFDYKIKEYHSIINVKLDGNKVITQEWKYYPPGYFFGKAIGLAIPDSAGVEFSQTTTANILDEQGKAEVKPLNAYFASSTTLITPFTNDSAFMTTSSSKSTTDSYRMLITHPTPDTRIIINLGIQEANAEHPKGDLRGISLFNGKRITQEELSAKKNELRAKYKVGFIVSVDKNGKYINEKLLGAVEL